MLEGGSRRLGRDNDDRQGFVKHFWGRFVRGCLT